MIAAGGKAKVDLRNLTALEKRLRIACRKAINRAGRPVRERVKAEAESIKRFGYLAKSIRTKIKLYDQDRHLLVVGPSKAYSRKLGRKRNGVEAKRTVPARYANVISSRKSGSKYRPWLRQAHDATAQQYLEAVRREIAAEIAKVLR